MRPYDKIHSCYGIQTLVLGASDPGARVGSGGATLNGIMVVCEHMSSLAGYTVLVHTSNLIGTPRVFLLMVLWFRYQKKFMKFLSIGCARADPTHQSHVKQAGAGAARGMGRILHRPLWQGASDNSSQHGVSHASSFNVVATCVTNRWLKCHNLPAQNGDCPVGAGHGSGDHAPTLQRGAVPLNGHLRIQTPPSYPFFFCQLMAVDGIE